MEDPVPGEETQETETPEKETPDAPEEAAKGEGEEEETHGQDAGEGFTEPPDEEPSEEKKYSKAEQLSEELWVSFRDFGRYLQEQLDECGKSKTTIDISGKEVNIQLCDELRLNIVFNLTIIRCPGKKSAQPKDGKKGGQE